MNTLFLETFVAVVDCGSLAEAARRLGITPAAAAKRVRALEDELSMRLVVRSGRTVRPTASGHAVVERGREALRLIQDVRNVPHDGEVRGELRIGSIPNGITGMLPEILMACSRQHPNLFIDIAPGRPPELYGQVMEGELDGAIIVRPPFELPKTLGWQLLREEPLMLLAPKRLAGSDPHALLTTEPFIRQGPNWAARLIDDYLRAANLAPRARFELVTLDAVAVLVDRGFGVALVPDWSPPWPEGLSLARMALPLPSPPRRIGFVWLRSSPRARLIDAFLAQARMNMPVVSSLLRQETTYRPG
ncbi:LysR family transcriptional regulator [Ancylobacter oerskovii]|uniref:LysR family transcriptional regulator n=1 Tax=Ancylobacter oerskovii TaxID=459519 RepID=A0ABW4YWU3_9HYPH|nr:LysR family transcriptional regulator [Ancylobacter oerskovii]MBS7542426.1 LysR family transcriptional regulator [Ancylobacter oerskovii]